MAKLPQASSDALPRITLSQKTLRSLMISGVMKRPSPLQNNLELRGDQPCISTDNPIKTSIKALNKDFDQLAIITQQSHKLYTLRIRAWGFRCPEPFDSTEDCLPLPTIQALLLVENLRVLVLDLSGGFLNSSGQQGNGYHLCPAIGALLCTLRTLHLRMRSICPDVLISRHSNSSLQLSEVVINLTAHSKRCGSQGEGLLQLKADLCEQAEALATQMAFPEFETKSLHVLTGKTMILEDASETESEIILDDEFSTFLDE
ncbi:hypothetical protein B0T26DRAFT_740017 [Lasiosphaeria miniovina]|uniref:Uncharacterized protein n=1 Tax=Lasiosphaeria miniovina TaxID=1954250 RepID=A0AA40E034_9PEZI|nr:uncharacterized protein B0T26DRAFT_740017 [Lasiosphaeria miniovina]KAK0722944.1 hypothetical protein B0T26DRAFT_740017 [Lasiosphaeria miniovina]